MTVRDTRALMQLRDCPRCLEWHSACFAGRMPTPGRALLRLSLGHVQSGGTMATRKKAGKKLQGR
jgi:hypothetical protein